VVFNNAYIFIARFLAEPLTMLYWPLVGKHRTNLSWSKLCINYQLDDQILFI